MRSRTTLFSSTILLRRIRVIVNEAFANMDELFFRMYEADVKSDRYLIAVVAIFDER